MTNLSDSDAEWGPARKVFSVLVFPLVFGGSVATAMALMHSGVDSKTAYLIPTGISFLTLAVLERLVSYRDAWRKADRDVRVGRGRVS